MKKLSNIVMIFILSITLFNPLVTNAEEINSPIKSIEETTVDTNSSNTDIIALDNNAKAGNTVTFADPELENKIASACTGDSYDCRDTSGDKLYIDATDGIQVSEMEQIGTLKIYFGTISDLGGIEYATNLTELIIIANNITDLTPLSGITSLKKLQLEENQISDLSPLANLTNLENLVLYKNQISDISPLANLTNLKVLFLDFNNITDISALSGLTNLEELYIDSNQISDLSVVANMPKLEVLSVMINDITDITAVANLTNLYYLNVSGNEITDITAVANLTNLTTLDISDTNVSDITPVTNLTNLENFFAIYDYITDITPLSNMSSLIQLDLRGNYIEDLSPLSGLTTLKFLNVSENQLDNEDVEYLVGLTDLKRLYMDENHISDFSSLEGLDLSTTSDPDVGWGSGADSQSIYLGSVDAVLGSTEITPGIMPTTLDITNRFNDTETLNIPTTISGDPTTVTNYIPWLRAETGGASEVATSNSFVCSYTDGYSEVPANPSDYTGCEYVAVPFSTDFLVAGDGSDNINYTGFSGWVYYQVNYSTFAINSLPSATITEETYSQMTDAEIKAELLTLFNVNVIDEDSVTQVTNDDISVDYSTCDFDHPGTCNVEFSFVGSQTGNTHTKNVTLDITNITPTITTAVDTYDVTVGDEEVDYASIFAPAVSGEEYLYDQTGATVLASDYEVTVSNNTCSIADGKYDTAGTCELTYSINDDDAANTEITKTVTINVAAAPVTPPDPEIPDPETPEVETPEVETPEVEEEQEIAVTGMYAYPIAIALVSVLAVALIRRHKN